MWIVHVCTWFACMCVCVCVCMICMHVCVCHGSVWYVQVHASVCICVYTCKRKRLQLILYRVTIFMQQAKKSLHAEVGGELRHLQAHHIIKISRNYAQKLFFQTTQNLTTVSIHSALSRSHIDVGRKWFCNFAVRQDDLPRRLVRVRPFRHGLRRGRMQQICYQRTKNQNPSHLGKSCSRL